MALVIPVGLPDMWVMSSSSAQPPTLIFDEQAPSSFKLDCEFHLNLTPDTTRTAAPLFLRLSFDNSALSGAKIESVRVISNAKFIELYNPEYDSSVRGSDPNKSNSFECVATKRLKAQTLAIKFLSLKDTELKVECIEIFVSGVNDRDSCNSSSGVPVAAAIPPAPPPSVSAPAASASAASAAMSMLPMLFELKKSFITEIAALIDVKLTPIVKRLDSIEMKIDSIEMRIDQLKPLNKVEEG